jgi:hypothetical protein
VKNPFGVYGVERASVEEGVASVEDGVAWGSVSGETEIVVSKGLLVSRYFRFRFTIAWVNRIF